MLCWFTPISVWIRRNLAGFYFKVRWMANKVFRVPENISCLLLKQSYCRKVKKVCKHHIIFQRFEQQKKGCALNCEQTSKGHEVQIQSHEINFFISFFLWKWLENTYKKDSVSITIKTSNPINVMQKKLPKAKAEKNLWNGPMSTLGRVSIMMWAE